MLGCCLATDSLCLQERPERGRMRDIECPADCPEAARSLAGVPWALAAEWDPSLAACSSSRAAVHLCALPKHASRASAQQDRSSLRG